MTPPTDTAPHPDHNGQPMREGDEAPPPGVRAMAIVRWSLVAAMAVVAGLAINHHYGWISTRGAGGAGDGTIYYCSMHPGIQQDHPGECPICSMTLVPMPAGGAGAPTPPAGAHDHAGEPTGEYWCPMHPEVTSTDPNATCAACGGMPLVPKPADAVAPPPNAEGVPGLVPVTLSRGRLQLMGMTTAKVTRETLSPELRTVGVVAASERGLAVIEVRFSGWIEDLKVEQTGQKVRKGQVLATIYSPELLTAQQEYLNALRWGDRGAAGGAHDGDVSVDLRKDARRRLELLGIAGPELAELERTGEPSAAIPIRSPVTGHVIEKNAVLGVQVQPGTALFQVADLSKVWVIADVYEHQIGRVAVGRRATVELAAFPGERLTGELTFVYPTLNPSTRTMRVRIELANPELRLKPAMFGDVYIALEPADSLVVPSEAVVDTGELQYVFIARPDGTFEPRRVTMGARERGKTQLLAGVAEGETVVTTATFLLDSESRLQAGLFGGAAGGAPATAGDVCETEFDQQKYPDKYQQCVACRAHRGMGSMEDDCRRVIPQPWK